MSAPQFVSCTACDWEGDIAGLTPDRVRYCPACGTGLPAADVNEYDPDPDPDPDPETDVNAVAAERAGDETGVDDGGA